MHSTVLDSSHQKELARFVATQAGSPIEQTWAWGELQTSLKGRPEFRAFAVVDEEGDETKGAFLASLLVVRQEMGLGKTWLWAPRGPVLQAGLAGEEADEAWRLLLEACRNWARLHGDVFLRVEPGVLPDGFALGGAPSSDEYLPSHTLTLDLSLSEKALLEQMAQKGRYNIKVAEKAGVVVCEGEDRDLDTFYAILGQTGARDGFGVHPLSFYQDFLSILGEAARLYVAEFEGRIVGGMIVTLFGDTATYYFGASSNEDRKVMAPYLLQWHAMCEAKKMGFKSYDFLGVAPDGTEGEKHVLAGVTQFKTRFGGTRVNTGGARVFVYRRPWWMLRNVVKSLRRALRSKRSSL